jgi:transposase
MKKTRKRFTEEFKAQAVELARSGRGVPDIARELEVETSCLYAWIRATNSQPSQVGSAGRRAVGEETEADELRRLRGENARLTLENDILKKAAVILGTKPPLRGAK